ncbi:MAG: DegT/DnrJ/EryC1/StrS family aminotransferase [Solirubrobacteraceae bacterium]
MIGDEEIAEVVDSLRSGWVGTGPKVHRFETLLSEYLGVEHCRCLSSCTAALILSLQVLGVRPGDEVLVPAMTFVASANAVEHAGATPVLVDSVPGTGLIDLEQAAAAITERTRAIMPVHLAGRPVDMDRLDALTSHSGLAVVEDAAHAIGAEWRGRKIGAWGNLCFGPGRWVPTTRAGWSPPTTSSTRPRSSTGSGVQTPCSRVFAGSLTRAIAGRPGSSPTSRFRLRWGTSTG